MADAKSTLIRVVTSKLSDSIFIGLDVQIGTTVTTHPLLFIGTSFYRYYVLVFNFWTNIGPTSVEQIF